MANATVKSEGLNLHASPSAVARVIDQLSRGDGLFLIEERKGWMKVQVVRTNQVGWVDANYVVVNIMPEPPPRPRPMPDHPPVSIPDDISDHKIRYAIAALLVIGMTVVVLWLMH